MKKIAILASGSGSNAENIARYFGTSDYARVSFIIANNPEIAHSGFNFVVDQKYTGNVILLQKGNDALTEATNAALASSKDLWEGWYNDAKALSGIDLSFDDEGNAITD